MTDDEERRRCLQLEAGPRQPSARAKIYLDLIAERVALADLLPEGSPEAMRLAQEAIGYAAFAVGRHLEHAYPTTDMGQRDQWLAVLRFLSGTLMFQYPLETLTLALTELDRGLVPEGLKKSGTAQGGKPTLGKLYWMRTAIEIVDEVVRQHDGHASNAGQFIEDEIGVSPDTLRKWRGTLARAAQEHRPRSFRRNMPPPPERIAETEEQLAARLAPLLNALRAACSLANERGKKHFLETTKA